MVENLLLALFFDRSINREKFREVVNSLGYKERVELVAILLGSKKPKEEHTVVMLSTKTFLNKVDWS